MKLKIQSWLFFTLFAGIQHCTVVSFAAIKVVNLCEKGTDNQSGFLVNESVIKGSVVSHPTNVNISEEGSLDWFFCTWSNNGATFHKEAPNLLLDYTLLNVDRYDWFLNAPTTYSWTNGKENKKGSKTDGHYVGGLVGRGLTFKVPADTTLRILKIYLGAYEAKGKITAQFEGSSQPVYTGSVTASQGGIPVEKLCVIEFEADSVGKMLVVKYEIERGYYQNFGSTDPKAITGNVSLNAVCLAKAVTTYSSDLTNREAVNLSVFPNPVSGQNPVSVSFNLDFSSDVSIKIFNILGTVVREVHYKNLNQGLHNIQIGNGGELRSGIYLVQFSANGKSMSRKFKKNN